MNIIRHYLLPNFTALKLCNEEVSLVRKYTYYIELCVGCAYFENAVCSYVLLPIFTAVAFGNKYYLMISVCVEYIYIFLLEMIKSCYL